MPARLTEPAAGGLGKERGHELLEASGVQLGTLSFSLQRQPVYLIDVKLTVP